MNESWKRNDDVNAKFSDVCQELFPGILDPKRNKTVRECFKMLLKESDKCLDGRVTLEDQAKAKTGHGLKGRKIDDSRLNMPRSNAQKISQFSQAGPSETVSVEFNSSVASGHGDYCDDGPQSSVSMNCQQVEQEEFCETFEELEGVIKKLREKLEKWRKYFERLNKQSDHEVVDCEEDSTSLENQFLPSKSRKPTPESQSERSLEKPQDSLGKMETSERKRVKSDAKALKSVAVETSTPQVTKNPGTQKRQIRHLARIPCPASCTMDCMFWLFKEMKRAVCDDKFVEWLSQFGRSPDFLTPAKLCKCTMRINALVESGIIKLVREADVSADNLIEILRAEVDEVKGRNPAFVALLLLTYEGADVGHCVALVSKNELETYDAQKQQPWPQCEDRLQQVKKIQLFEINKEMLDKYMPVFGKGLCVVELLVKGGKSLAVKPSVGAVEVDANEL